MQSIAKLRSGDPTLDDETLAGMIAFLDMHLDRGRYADQTEVRTPAVLLKTDGTIEGVEFNVADRLLLSQSTEDVIRLKALGLGSWEWRVILGAPSPVTVRFSYFVKPRARTFAQSRTRSHRHNSS